MCCENGCGLAAAIDAGSDRDSLRARLRLRRRRREGGVVGAMRLDLEERRAAGQVRVDAARIGELRDEANIGKRRRRAEAVGPAPAVLEDELLAGAQALLDPVPVPGVDHVLLVPERALEVFQDAQVV